MNTTQNKIIVFDTTLRDGQQGPGNAMTIDGKVAIAHCLEEMNIDVIEAGYAISSDIEMKSIQQIAKEVRGPVICSLSLSRQDSIEAAAKALEGADKARIHLYLGSSPKHREIRKMSKQQVLDMSADAVRIARKSFSDIQYSGEDGANTEPEFLVELANAVHAEGASTFNIPDTLGAKTPRQLERLFRYMYDQLPAVRKGKLVISTHNHNDKGLANSNTLSAVQGGARQVEGTILGIGERAGNAATEQTVMAIHYNGTEYESPFGIPDVSHINTPAIYNASLTTAAFAHHSIPANQPYSGANAYNTQSGTHVNLIRRDPTTYYATNPADIGRETHEISIGSMSGRDAVFGALDTLGFVIPPEDKSDFFAHFKTFADAKRESGGTVSEKELEQLVYDCYAYAIFDTGEDNRCVASTPALIGEGRDIQLNFLIKTKPRDGYKPTIDKRTPSVTRFPFFKDSQGIICAVAEFLEEETRKKFNVIRQQQRSLGEGAQTKSESTVTIGYNGQIFTGIGIHTDTDESNIRALLDAINQSYLPRKK